jgi:hypothetical protein
VFGDGVLILLPAYSRTAHLPAITPPGHGSPHLIKQKIFAALILVAATAYSVFNLFTMLTYG